MIMMNDVKSSKYRRLKRLFPVFQWVGAHFTFLVTWKKADNPQSGTFVLQFLQTKIMSHKWYPHVKDGIPILYNFLKLTLNLIILFLLSRKTKKKITLIFEVFQTE